MSMLELMAQVAPGAVRALADLQVATERHPAVAGQMTAVREQLALKFTLEEVLGGTMAALDRPKHPTPDESSRRHGGADGSE